MLARFLSGLRPVHIARTKEEREAIYRFRYRIYAEELQREIGGVDHANRRICDDEDERSHSHHFYVGTPDDIQGAVRLRAWDAGAMPQEMAEKLSLHRFGAAQAWLRTSEIGRFMIDPKRRGSSLLLLAMARFTYEFLAGECLTDVSFCTCRPGLVNYYRRLGTRPYGADLVDEPEGMEVPLVSVLSDYHYYRRMKSPMTPWVKHHFRSGRRAEVDTRDFAHLFDASAQNIITDRDAVWLALSPALHEDGAAPDGSFLRGLPEPTLRRLMSNGFLLDVPAGRLITREGHIERELYVVLSGEVEVFRGDHVIARLGCGEVFGEMAFFHEDGKRSASVRALRDCRIVTLRRKWVDDLTRSDPAGAAAIMFNLARVLARRAEQPRA